MIDFEKMNADEKARFIIGSSLIDGDYLFIEKNGRGIRLWFYHDTKMFSVNIIENKGCDYFGTKNAKEVYDFLVDFLSDNNNPPKDRIKDTEESLVLLSNQPTIWGCMWMFLLNSGEVIQCMTKNIDNTEARKKAMQILEARGY